MNPLKKCPCQSGAAYAHCCQPYHQGQLAPDPLKLMRARYSAFHLNLPDFLIDTTAPDNPAFRSARAAWRRDLKRYCRRTQYTALRIVAVEPGPHSAEGFVTFQVALVQNGRPSGFQERSRFVKAAGQWLYHSGEVA